MASYIADAIEIITNDGTGIPSTYTNTAVGVDSDGHFYLITDRFGLNGTPTVTGDTTRTTWYEGILTRDFGSFTISKNADFVEAGCSESVSGFQFSIVNTSAFWNTLATNGVYLSRRVVKYYRVTASSLSGPFNFELRWTGVIDDQPFNELTQIINCVDASKDTYKTIPSTAINSNSFPNAPSNNFDKFLPVVIGRVAYSPLINVTGNATKVNLINNNGVIYTVVSSTVYGVSSPGIAGYLAAISLKLASTTSSVSTSIPFYANDSRITGKFLNVIAGGVAQSVLIVQNSASSYGSMDLFLANNLDVSTPYVAYGSANAWYFEIVDLHPTLIASNRPISEFKAGKNNADLIYSYSSQLNKFVNDTQIKILSDLTNIQNIGYPGVTITSINGNGNGALTGYYSITPRSILQVSNTFTSTDFPSITSPLSLLTDRDETAGHYYTLNKSSTGAAFQLAIDIFLPSADTFSVFDELYLLFDFIHNSPTMGIIGINPIITTYDMYGTATNVINFSFSNFTLTSVDSAIYLLPASYVNSTRDDSSFYKSKATLKISDYIKTAASSQAISKMRLTLNFAVPNFIATYIFKFLEVGFVGKRSISASNDSLFSSIVGETFGTSWAGRKTTTAPVLLLGDAIEKIAREYDESSKLWEANKVYYVGDKIKSTLDTGHIYICTVGGTSAATEPVWSTTAGATFTDNTITWKEFKTIAIDTPSFDLVTTQRPDWFIGRAITEKKQTSDYYSELLSQGFLISAFDKNGRMKIKAWRENKTPVCTFDQTVILSSTIGNMTLTPMRRVYNDITVNYDYNYGNQKFNKKIVITNVDKAVFPSVFLLSGTYTTLSSFSMSWALGVLTVTKTAHNLNNRSLVTLQSNSSGYNFDPNRIYIVDADHFIVLGAVLFPTFSGAPSSFTSTSGTMSSVTNSYYVWNSYVSGIQNYTVAKTLWTQCNNSYKITRTVNKLPQTLGDCYWFIDPIEFDPSGKQGYENLIWTTNGVPDLNVGDNHPAAYFVRQLVDWAAWQKKQITFEIPEKNTLAGADTVTYNALEIGDPVYFSDAKLTNGASLLGWVHEKTQLPRQNGQVERFKIGVTLQPEQYTDPNIIDEHLATDIIDEHGATNIYDEHGA